MLFNSAREKGTNGDAEDIRSRMMRIKSLRNSVRKESVDDSTPATPVGTPTKKTQPERKQDVLDKKNTSQDNESTEVDETNEEKAKQLKEQIVQQIKLPQILTDPKRREIFKDFSEKEHSLQNLLFLERCKKFKKLKDEETKVADLLQISNLFLSKEADYPLDVNREAVERVEKTIFRSQKISETVFDELIAEVVLKLHETFARFKESEDFLQCI
eukprot:gene7700-12166_t